jgi:hypothetical protein
MIKSFADEFRRYKIIGQKAMDQLPEEALNKITGPDHNSIAVIVRHISGNLLSRFTDFVTSDGEKPWRNRDSEFSDVKYDRQTVDQMWNSGWQALESQLAVLTDADLSKVVYIRRQPLTVHEALARSLAHISYHVGQVVLLARILKEGEWRWISIPKGKSQVYNQNPTIEKIPQR